jgi:hypothetical protein
MEAGRTLDERVAREVMWWVRHPDPHQHQWCVRDLLQGTLRLTNFVACDCTDHHAGLTFNPSTDIAHAWRVVDEVRLFAPRVPDGGGLDVGYQLQESAGGEWEIKYRWGAVMWRAATAPLVICLAALDVAKDRVIAMALPRESQNAVFATSGIPKPLGATGLDRELQPNPLGESQQVANGTPGQEV